MRRPLFLGVVALAASPALAEPALTEAPSMMRVAPSPAAGVIQAIPASAQIHLRGCRADWCYASWRNRSGYIPAYAVSGQAAPPPGYNGPPPGYEAPPVEGGGGAVVIGPPPAAPGHSWGGPYVGGGWGWQRW